MADTAPDLTKTLEDIRREAIEARNMTIKTDNALKSLHAELKTVSANQDAFARRTWFSTGVAYLGFIALCVGAVIAISGARASAANSERERLEKQTLDLNGQIDKLKGELTAQASAERAAGEVYKLMTAAPGEERLKGIDALGKLEQAKLSPFLKQVLNDRAAALRKEVGAAVFDKGKAAFRRSDWPETMEQLNRFLSMNPGQDELVEALYYLGNAEVQARKFEDGIKHLSGFVEGDKKAKNRDFAMLLLMQAYDATGQKEKAVETAREALSTYPSSEFRGPFYFRIQRRAGGQGQGQGTTAPAATGQSR